MVEKKHVIDVPSLMAEWDWERNNQAQIFPQVTTLGSDKRVHWICENNHRWQTSVRPRFIDKTKCPYCAGKKPIVGITDLATTHPKLCLEWNTDKNIGIYPTDVSKGTTRKIWWKCSSGHEWQASVGSRVRGSGCPYCSNQMVLLGYNDLRTTAPELVAEWHPTNNGDLTPLMFTRGSGKKVWWKCNTCGFEWQTSIALRTKDNATGCPQCARKAATIPTAQRSLLLSNPSLSSEWHPTKNSDLQPIDIFPSHKGKVWWKCAVGHEWQATVVSRNLGAGCPFCQRIEASRVHSLPPQKQSLLHMNPTLAAEWNYVKNAELKPEATYAHSSKKVWWKCAVGHEWQATVASRNRGSGCPLCKKELHTSFPEQAICFYINKLFPDAISRYSENNKELDVFIPSVNIGIEYDGMHYHTSETQAKEDLKDKYFFDREILVIRVKESSEIAKKAMVCNNVIFYSPKRNYRYLDEAIVLLFDLITKTCGLLIGDLDVSVERDATLILQSFLSILKERSVLSNGLLASEWNYEKNNGLNPSFIPANSGKKVWWKCSKGHEWQAIVASRNSGVGCPYCSNQRVLVGYNDLSFLLPDLAKEWHPTKNGDLLPQHVSIGTTLHVWWMCSKGHEWQASIESRSKGVGCPYCSNQKVLAGYNDLQTVAPQLAAEWHPTKNGELMPQMVTSGSGKKVWWMCSKGHEWQAFINNRNKGAGCPICYRENKKPVCKTLHIYNAVDLSFLGEFESAKAFCEHFDLDYSKKKTQITAICKRKRKALLHKFIIRYANDDEFAT